MTLLESFTAADWIAVITACALIILIPSLLFVWIIALPGIIFRFVTRRRGRAGASSAEPQADLDSVWSDIEQELER